MVFVGIIEVNRNVAVTFYRADIKLKYMGSINRSKFVECHYGTAKCTQSVALLFYSYCFEWDCSLDFAGLSNYCLPLTRWKTVVVQTGEIKSNLTRSNKNKAISIAVAIPAQFQNSICLSFQIRSGSYVSEGFAVSHAFTTNEMINANTIDRVRKKSDGYHVLLKQRANFIDGVFRSCASWNFFEYLCGKEYSKRFETWSKYSIYKICSLFQ